MNKQEQARFAKNFLKRRTSYIVSHQSGFNEQFGVDPYNGDTQQDTVDSSSGAPTHTKRADVATGGEWSGTVPGAVPDGDGSVVGAIDILQQHIASLGDSNLLDIWASTAAALRKTVSRDAVKKAVPNPDGVTRSPLVVGDNTAASWPGSSGYIPASELSNAKAVARFEAEVASLTKLTSKIVEVTSL